MAKSVPGAAPGLPNRSQDPLGTPRGAQGRPGAVSERLGSVPGEPRELQENSQGRPRTPKEAPGNAPERAEATKLTPSRARKRKNRVFVARRVREASSKRFFNDFRQFFVFLQNRDVPKVASKVANECFFDISVALAL